MPDSDSARTEGEERGERDEREERVHRRGFFTHGFRQLLKPLAELVEQRMERLNIPELTEEVGAAPAAGPGHYGYSEPYPAGEGADAPPAQPSRRLLRPPGALPEGEFLARCTSSGRCVEVCPVRAIKLVPSVEPQKDRKPAIDPAAQACVVCDDLSCMKACPTGALQLVPRSEIRMGLAVLRPAICVRTHGEDCRICADKCPIGPSAIEISSPDAAVAVKDGCTGCGVCEMYCPTDPRAIVVEART